MIINGSDPIDGESVNDVYAYVDKLKNKIVDVLWRNAKGENDKTIKSSDGRKLKILAGTVNVNDRTGKNEESSIRVNFYQPFGGKKDPTVVAMPESVSPYGVSIKNVNREGFTLVIHTFADASRDDKDNLRAVNYIAVGME